MRYFIGYELNGISAELVDGLRVLIANEFSVKEALRYPPHLTLFYPFEAEGDILKECLEKFAETRRGFELKVNGFNSFGEAVWFVDVEQSAELFELKNELVEMMKNQLQISEDTGGRNGTHFHVTLAYKDVTPEKFKLIGEYLKGHLVPIENLEVNSVTLFGRNGENWEVVERFNFRL